MKLGHLVHKTGFIQFHSETTVHTSMDRPNHHPLKAQLYYSTFNISQVNFKNGHLLNKMVKGFILKSINVAQGFTKYSS